MKRHQYTIASAFALPAVLCVAHAAPGQVSEMMRFDAEAYQVQSGIHHGPPITGFDEDAKPNLELKFSTLVAVPRANMMRVFFGEFELGELSEIRIASLADDGWQRFTHASLSDWEGWSAIFNGNAVLIELHVAPGESASFEIHKVSINDPPVVFHEGDVNTTICDGSDSRVSSSDSRVGRVSHANCGSGGGCGGCTAWLASIGAVISAGHCNASNRLIEFNVPQSQSNGTPVAAHPNHQYPIGTNWYAFQDADPGFDWAIMNAGANSNTGSFPHWVQNHFHLSPSLVSNSTTVRLTGYGIDNSPLGTQPGVCCGWTDGQCSTTGCNSSAHTLQTSTGPKTDHTTNRLLYRADTMGGNSGSPIIWNSTGFAIGVHTHGGCTASGGANTGTRIDQSVFHTWLDNWLNNRIFVDTANVHFAQFGSALFPAQSFAFGYALTPSNGTMAVAKGNYSGSGVFDKAVTITAVSGIVTIGQ